MIRIHRNHPSIIIWSMGNELWFTSNLDSTVAVLKRMIAVAHTEDSTRPVGVGGVQVSTAQLSQPCDVVGFNGGMTTGNAGIPSMVSEYGAGSCGHDRGENYNACYGDNITTPPSPADDAWRAGISYWCGFCYGSVAVDNGYTNDGMIDHARLVQKRWYFYRNLYLGTPPPVMAGSRDRGQAQINYRQGHHYRRRQKRRAAHRPGAGRLGELAVEYPEHHADRPVGAGRVPYRQPITFTGGAANQCVRNGQASIEFRSYNAGTVNDPGDFGESHAGVSDPHRSSHDRYR